MRGIKGCALVVTMWLAAAGIAAGQGSSSSLQGTVTDPSGSAIAGAKIVLANDESRIERSTETDARGEYRLLALPPGTYRLAVNSKGFSQYVQTGLQLLVNTPATVNVQLKVGATTENITVTSEAPALNAVDASLGNSFGETQVKEVPIEARNVPELLSLQAGVTYTGHRLDLQDPSYKDQDTRSGAVNGARSDQSNITLDGVDVNDQANGYAFTSVLPTTVDSVQEFRVTTSNYNADQGTGSGAQVALVTKSGTNQFHGSLYEYLRNTVTSANDYFVSASESRLGQANKPDKLNYNIFGASVGGPIWKDRLFFFANYEGTRQRQEISTVRAIPTSSSTAGAQTMCNGYISYADVNGGTTVIPPTGPQSLQTLDPLGLGVNSAVLDLTNHSSGYFDKTFCTGQFLTNDPSVGDGLNYSGFRFRAPTKLDNNAFIARIDYHVTANGKHTLFWRGSLQNLFNPGAPFLPGSAPEITVADHSKGFVLGYTALLSTNAVNTFHWGFTRQSTGFIGNTQQEWNSFYGLDQGFNYSHNAQTPVHNVLDDFSWTHARHTLQFGVNAGFARAPRVSNEHSFPLGKGATNWMSPTGFANTGGYLDPANQGFAEPASAFAYDYPTLALLGMVSDIVGNYNYDKQGVVQSPGLPVKRKYGLNWYELYAQDSWRVRPNLTLTYGLRWSMFPPPWEVNGYEAVPTVNLGNQFDQIVKNMKQGLGYDSVPLVSFMLGGRANNTDGLYNFEKKDFSPRISFAYTPRPRSEWLRKLVGEGDKTVLRGGFSKVFDRPGMQLLNTFDANPPGGLGATIQNPCCVFGYDDAAHVPRITDINTVPTYGCDPSNPSSCGSPANQQFFLAAPPAMNPPATNQAITWGVDQGLKTPYSYAFDFSIGRELPNHLSLQVAYVGRLGRNLLTQRDLRQPLDIVDPKTGIDYYSAATDLAKIAFKNQFSDYASYANFVNSLSDASVPTAAYWHDMLPPLQTGTGATNFSSYGLSGGYVAATPGDAGLIQAIYDLYYDPFLSYAGNEVVGIGNVDLYGGLEDNAGNFYYPCPTPGCKNLTGGVPGNYLNNQATSMFAWSSVGRSSYNALQANLRKQFSSGMQFDLNYTYSKSIDISSAATRLSWSSSTNVGAPGTRLVNAFDPNGRRAVSDFDTTHQFNANWIANLPFGKSKRFAGNAQGAAEAIIGGWQLSGVVRWTSGFPFSVDNGNFWPTNWDEQGIAQMIAKPRTGHFRQANGTISVFADASTAITNFQHPYPGQSGSRNAVRGDGYAGWDMALNKSWKMPWENHSLQFRWEVFNIPNLHRFNVLSGVGNAACACIASLQQVPERFGAYTGLLTDPRVMQFALRYEF